MNDPNHLPLPNSSEQVRVRSNGRIHFGLIEICESEPHCYGGIGLMVENSIAVVQAATCLDANSKCSILADAYWKPRIEAVANHWLTTHSRLPVDSISVIESPLPHQGMGSGTQLACTISALLAAADSKPLSLGRTAVFDSPIGSLAGLFTIDSLAKTSLRGKRSNIGLCGFLEGGFVVDLGMLSKNSRDEESNNRTHRVDFPDWPVLILQDTESRGDSGDDEVRMFEQCSRRPNPNRDAMLHTVQQEILPAIASVDWNRFDVAMGSYGRWAGLIFEPVQGGVYRSQQIAHCIDVALKLGLRGATQSSWGPTVCAFAKDAEHASWCQSQLQTELPKLKVSTTRAVNGPAQVEWL